MVTAEGAETRTGDRSVLIRSVLDGSPAQLWRACTDPAVVSEWFEPCARIGPNHYRLSFTEEDGLYQKYITAKVCEHGPRGWRLSLLLEDPGYRDSTVIVAVTALTGRMAEVELRHDEPDARLLEGYRTGWADYLGRLATHAAGDRSGPGGLR